MEPDRALEALLESESVGVALLDRELRYVRVNDALERTLGRGELTGRSVEDVHPAGPMALIVPLLRRAVEGTPTLGRRVERNMHPLMVDYLPIRDAKGAVDGVAVVVSGLGATPQAADERLRDRLAFEQLTTHMSTRLIATLPEELPGALREALQQIAESLDFDRAGIVAGEASQRYLAHEWHRPEVASMAVLFAAPDRQVGWPASLLAGHTLVSRPEELPFEQPERERMSEGGKMQLSVASPVFLDGKMAGAIILQARELSPRSDGEIASRVQLFAGIVCNAWARERAELDRQRAYQELQQLKTKIEQERDYLREEVRADHGEGAILGKSAAIRRTLAAIDAVATTSATVLLQGESGVGKELFARVLHARSGRADAPLVKVNCASIPRELFESEFFGHVRGAFTGALKDRTGRFELANNGTLFLDEVGEIPPEQQAKLLRVLQEGELERVGDDRTRKVNVRIVAATNRDLEGEIRAGRFRQDLYYRLSAFPVEVPPLRERDDDVTLLAEYFLRESMRAFSRRGLELSAEQREQLHRYHWPGNVRELQHVIERAVILSQAPPLHLELALPSLGAAAAPAPAAAAPPAAAPAEQRSLLTEEDLRDLERRNLVAALDKAGGRVAGPGGAAELLGIRPSTLRDRMRSLGLDRKR